MDVRTLFRLSPLVSPWPSAVRRGGVMAVILIVGVLSGQYEAAIAATTGALNIALLDAAVSRSSWSRALWLCLFATTAVAFVAVIVGDDVLWLVGYLTVLAFLQGALSRAGVAIANATIAGMITAILFSVVPGSVPEAAVAAAWLFLGGLAEVLVALVAWTGERQSLLRRQTRRTLRAASADVDGPRADLWRQAALRTLRTTELTPIERRGYAELLETSRDRSSAEDLSIAEHVLRRGGPEEGGGRAGDAARSIRTAADRLEPQTTQDVAQQWRQLSGFLRPGTASFTAGLRLALLMAVGTAVVHVADIPQGHWALLAFALAIRPSYTDTIIGLVARVIGVVVGVLITSAVADVTGGSIVVLLALAAVSGVLACRWLMGNDILFFTFLTVFVSVLVDAGDPLSGFGVQRIWATCVGAGIGLVGAVLWPSWRRTVAPS